MSLSRQQTTTEECKHCHEPIDVFYAPGYCSKACYYRFKGANVLEEIQRDHKFCATCFRQIKTVARPDGVEVRTDPVEHEAAVNEEKNLFIGWQYATKHMEVAEDDLGGINTNPEGHDRLIAPSQVDFTRWSCICGNVDPSNRDEIIEAVEVDEIVPQLYYCLEALHTQGTIDVTPEWSELRSALRDQWRDWEYCIGRTLNSSSP